MYWLGSVAVVIALLNTSVVFAQVDNTEVDADAMPAVGEKAIDSSAIATLSQALAREFPQALASPKEAVYAARTLEKASRWSDALAMYDTVIKRHQMDYWTQLALSQKANICSVQGCTNEALAAIAQLKAEFPEATETAQAMVLEDRLAGRNAPRNQVIYDEEIDASAKYREAASLSSTNIARACQLLDAVHYEFPNTPAAIRSLDTKAYLMSKAKNRPEAILAWEMMLGIAEPIAPKSRVCLRAKLRVATLYAATNQRERALALLDDVVRAGESPAAGRAAMMAAAVSFEIIQKSDSRSASDVQWDQVRQWSRIAMNSKHASRAERVRAETILIETFCWQGKPVEAIQAGKQFLEKHNDTQFKQDAATVRFFVGEQLQAIGQYDEALACYRRVIQLYEGKTHIWAGMDHLPRTYYRIWETLRRIQSSPEAITDAANALITAFPDSSYATRVKAVQQAEAQ